MNAFDAGMIWVLQAEGVLSLDRNDRGNWTGGEIGVGELRGTKYGISAKAYPKLDVAALTIQQAREIYRADYWDRLHCDDLPPALALAVFDSAVNQGAGAAAKTLQTALRVTADGVVGPATVDAAKHSTPEAVIPTFLAMRAIAYISTHGASSFLRGWLVRLFRLAMQCGKVA